MALHFLNFILNLPVHPIKSVHASNLLTLAMALGWLYLVMVAILLIGLIGLLFVRRLPALLACYYQKLRRRELGPRLVFLELAFPWDLNKSAYATEQLYVVIKGQYRYLSFLDKLVGHRKYYSLELVGSSAEGIRYLMVVPFGETEHITRSLLSFLPAIKIRPVDDYLDSLSAKRLGVTELKLARDFGYPLQNHKALEEHDPMAFITGCLTGLGDHELVAVQLVITPVHRSTHLRVIKRIRKIKGVIQRGNRLGPELSNNRFRLPRVVWICLLLPVWIFIGVLKFGLNAAAFFIDPYRKDFPASGMSNRNTKRDPTDLYEQELVQLVKTKLDQGLFEVSLRILVAAETNEAISQRQEALVSAYQMFSSSYQALVPKGFLPLVPKLKQSKWLTERYLKRQLTPNVFAYGSILSSAELSDIYHFPNSEMTKTEGLLKSRSRDLPTPLSQKTAVENHDIRFGVNDYGGAAAPIGLPLEQRRKHVYIIGKTGMGKTTLIKSAIYQDMVNGKGVAVLDPHGDMFHELLGLVPEHRLKDLVIFDPSDREYPLGLNILDPGIAFASEDDRQEWITATVLSVFSKLTDEALWGPRMEHILRSTTMTALSIPGASLFTVQRLLTDRKYQREVAATLSDPVLKNFWLKEFSLWGTMQQASAIGPLTHRLGHFITTKMSRHILLQPKSTLKLGEIMDEGKILLVNLSKGEIGEDESFFFGTILTSFIWMAAYQRIKVPEYDRPDFFVYVDEFQNFATPRFAEIFSEARKFHVSLTVSHQNIAQVADEHILKVVAGNAGTLISFRISPEDEAYLLPHMKPVVEKGDMVNLPPYKFYLKVTGQDSEDAFSGLTVPLDVISSEAVRKAAIAYSQKQYGMPKKEVEAYMEKLFGGTAAPKPKAAKKSGAVAGGDTKKIPRKIHGA